MAAMLIAGTIAQARGWVAARRAKGIEVGFVPTMGALHDGHAALVRRAVSENSAVVVSVFVNPLQFGPKEDFSKYPRTLEDDARLCAEAGAGMVFAADAREMYPEGFATAVDVAGITDRLCGASRPGHFRGVATVVTKLFNIVQPTRAYLGQKDFQQCAVIRRMVSDLSQPVEIVVCPTVREPDGVAMSSRNRYLGDDERRAARCLSRGLLAACDLYSRGKQDAAGLLAAARAEVGKEKLARPDYIELVDSGTLEPVIGEADQGSVMALAVFIGTTRLIDNARLEAGI